jgi:hypothetical protein
MKINHDVVDGRFKVHLPTKIVFDMSARFCDNKKKIGITFNVL